MGWAAKLNEGRKFETAKLIETDSIPTFQQFISFMERKKGKVLKHENYEPEGKLSPSVYPKKNQQFYFPP